MLCLLALWVYKCFFFPKDQQLYFVYKMNFVSLIFYAIKSKKE